MQVLAHEADAHLHVCIEIIILNTKSIIFNTKFIDFNANRYRDQDADHDVPAEPVLLLRARERERAGAGQGVEGGGERNRGASKPLGHVHWRGTRARSGQRVPRETDRLVLFDPLQPLGDPDPVRLLHRVPRGLAHAAVLRASGRAQPGWHPMMPLTPAGTPAAVADEASVFSHTDALSYRRQL